MKLSKFPEANGPHPYTWYCEGSKPGPTVTISGGTHGNEPTGVALAHEMAKMAVEGEIEAGTLKVSLNNPEAVQANQRSVGQNMNLTFGFSGEPTSNTEERVLQLQEFFEGTEILFDGHNEQGSSTGSKVIIPTTQDIEALGVPGAKNLTVVEILKALGIPTVLKGKAFLPESKEPGYLDSYILEQNGLGITIEGGSKKSPKTEEVQEGVLYALAMLGLLKAPDKEPSDISLEVWNAAHKIMAQAGLKLKKFKSGHITEKETKIGSITVKDGRDPIKKSVPVGSGSMLVFPKSGNVKPGQMAAIIAKHEKTI